MRVLPASQALRYDVKPPLLEVNWGHPLSVGLVRAIVYSEGSQGSAASGLARELVYDQLVTNNAPIHDDLPGLVAHVTGSTNAGSLLDHPDLTPATGVGVGGWTIASGIYLASNSVANQIAHKYTASNLEWIHGLASTTLYAWFYDQTASAYIGRTAPAPTAAVWHNVCCTWDGSTAASGVKLWVDALKVDNADFASGAFVQVRDLTANVLIGSSNGGLGGTTDTKYSYVYLFRRGLFPDEVAWLNDDPYALLHAPGRGLAVSPPAPAAGSGGFFFGA